MRALPTKQAYLSIFFEVQVQLLRWNSVVSIVFYSVTASVTKNDSISVTTELSYSWVSVTFANTV